MLLPGRDGGAWPWPHGDTGAGERPRFLRPDLGRGLGALRMFLVHVYRHYDDGLGAYMLAGRGWISGGPCGPEESLLPLT